MDDLLSALPGPWKSAFILFMVGVLAGAGGSFWRVDKFTGTEGRQLADRITKLEDKYRAVNAKCDEHWHAFKVWEEAINGKLHDIRKDDLHLLDELTEWKGNCGAHTEDAEKWKRRIERNEQAIDNLWKWYQRLEQ